MVLKMLVPFSAIAALDHEKETQIESLKCIVEPRDWQCTIITKLSENKISSLRWSPFEDLAYLELRTSLIFQQVVSKGNKAENV